MRRMIPLAFLVFLVFQTTSSAAQFKPYPGAAVDSKASRKRPKSRKEPD